MKENCSVRFLNTVVINIWSLYNLKSNVLYCVLWFHCTYMRNLWKIWQIYCLIYWSSAFTELCPSSSNRIDEEIALCVSSSIDFLQKRQPLKEALLLIHSDWHRVIFAPDISVCSEISAVGKNLDVTHLYVDALRKGIKPPNTTNRVRNAEWGTAWNRIVLLKETVHFKFKNTYVSSFL